MRAEILFKGRDIFEEAFPLSNVYAPSLYKVLDCSFLCIPDLEIIFFARYFRNRIDATIWLCNLLEFVPNLRERKETHDDACFTLLDVAPED